MSREVVVVSGVRTAIGTFGGSLKDIPPTELGATVVKEVLARGKTDGKESFKSIGAGHAKDAHSDDPMMHTTATVDYIIVLKGEIYAIMESGEKKLKEGDILVQRGTKHSWSVRTKRPCIIAAVLVSSKPLRLPRKPARRKAARKSAK